MEFILYISIFMCGYVTALFLSHLLSLGQGISIIKQTVHDSLLMMANSSQKAREFNELNYFSMRKEGKNEDQIAIVERYDKMQINSMENILIRNLITKIPNRYSGLFNFHDWNTAMEYLKKGGK